MIRVSSHIARLAIFATGMLLIFGSYYIYKKQAFKGAIITEGVVTRNYMHGINKSDFGSTVSAEIKYYANDSLITFLGAEGQPMTVGELVPVIYMDNDRTNAKVYTFNGFWLTGLLWCLLPAIFWVAVCFSLIEVGLKHSQQDLK